MVVRGIFSLTVPALRSVRIVQQNLFSDPAARLCDGGVQAGGTCGVIDLRFIGYDFQRDGGSGFLDFRQMNGLNVFAGSDQAGFAVGAQLTAEGNLVDLAIQFTVFTR